MGVYCQKHTKTHPQVMGKMYSPCCQRTCYTQKVTVFCLYVSQRGPQNPANQETMQNNSTSRHNVILPRNSPFSDTSNRETHLDHCCATLASCTTHADSLLNKKGSTSSVTDILLLQTAVQSCHLVHTYLPQQHVASIFRLEEIQFCRRNQKAVPNVQASHSRQL
jgi:hypothetical protein